MAKWVINTEFNALKIISIGHDLTNSFMIFLATKNVCTISCSEYSALIHRLCMMSSTLIFDNLRI